MAAPTFKIWSNSGVVTRNFAHELVQELRGWHRGGSLPRRSFFWCCQAGRQKDNLFREGGGGHRLWWESEHLTGEKMNTRNTSICARCLVSHPVQSSARVKGHHSLTTDYKLSQQLLSLITKQKTFPELFKTLNSRSFLEKSPLCKMPFVFLKRWHSMIWKTNLWHTHPESLNTDTASITRVTCVLLFTLHQL